MAVGRKGIALSTIRSILSKRLRTLIRQHRPSKSLTIAFDGPAPLAKARLQRKRRKSKLTAEVSKADLLGVGITPGCELIMDLHDVASQVGDEWLQKFPQAEFVLSNSCVPGEAEVKVFSALRTRHARHAHARHTVVCCDGDAVIMALMLPATLRLTIDFGRLGAMQLHKLQTAWAINGMRSAGVPPWPRAEPPQHEFEAADRAVEGGLKPPPMRTRRPGPAPAQEYPPEQLEGVLRDLAAIILLDKGNDYLAALPLADARDRGGPHATYFKMRAQARWRHRTLVVLDPGRAAAALDVDMLLRFLLSLHLQTRSGLKQARVALAQSAAAGGGVPDAATEAAALGAALEHAMSIVHSGAKEFPGLQPDACSSAVWEAWRTELPEDLQLHSLVAAATEPRVAAARDAWAEAVGAAASEAGEADREHRGGSVAMGMQEISRGSGVADMHVEAEAVHLKVALGSVKAASHALAAAHLAGLRWCLQMYAFSYCPSFRLLPPLNRVTTPSVIALLALGWAEHVLAAASAAPPPLAAWHRPAADAAVAVLRAAAPVRYGAIVDRTLTAASPGGLAADADVAAEELHAYLNHLEFEGLGVKPATLPMLLPVATNAEGPGTEQQEMGAQGDGAEGTSSHPLLLYAPDFTCHQGGDWRRVRARTGATGVDGCAARGEWGTWCEADEVSPQLAVPGTELSWLDISDDMADDAITSMYTLSLAEARRRIDKVRGPQHPLALLSPHLSYHLLQPHSDGGNDSDSPQPHYATPLQHMLADGDAATADALLEAATAFYHRSARRGRASDAKEVGSQSQRAAHGNDAAGGGSGPPAGHRGSAGDELAARLSREDVTVAPAPPRPRGTAPLSPLAHGVFVLPRVATLQVLPEATAGALQQREGAEEGNGAAAGLRVFDEISPPCSLCDTASAHLRASARRLRQCQHASGAAAAAAAALLNAARTVAVRLQTLAATDGGASLQGQWHPAAAAALTGSAYTAAQHSHLLALVQQFAAAAEASPPKGRRKRPRPGGSVDLRVSARPPPPPTRRPAVPAGAADAGAGAATGEEAEGWPDGALALQESLARAWERFAAEAAGGVPEGASAAESQQGDDIMVSVQHAAEVADALHTGNGTDVTDCDEGPRPAALAAAFSLSAALHVRVKIIQQTRLEEVTASTAAYKAAIIAVDLHNQLSHNAYDTSPGTLERRLSQLPGPPTDTSCALATARWATLEPPGGRPAADSPTHVRGMLVAQAGGISGAALAEAAGGGVAALAPRPVQRPPADGMPAREVMEAFLLDRQAVACLPAFMPRMRHVLGPAEGPAAEWGVEGPVAPRPSQRSGSGRLEERHSATAKRAVQGQCRSSVRPPAGADRSPFPGAAIAEGVGVRRMRVSVRGVVARACVAKVKPGVGVRFM